VNCPAKADIAWSMSDITSEWKNAWVLPCMAYDIIIDTDWMEKFDPHVSFQNRKITVAGQSVEMENIREDLIRECTLIQAWEVENLLKEDKIVEMVVWSLTKNDEEVKGDHNAQIDAFLEEFANVFSNDLRPPLDCGTHN
jgi:hypothetical protein